MKLSIDFSDYRYIYVAFSGGLDSSVLLHMLAVNESLRQRVIALHVHHGLSAYADEWQAHCHRVCDAWQVSCISHRVAFERHCNIEEHARRARYEFFTRMLGRQDVLLMAHHQDDQAETLLLQLLRGAGIEGLAAMPAQKSLGEGSLMRPLLSYSKQTLHEYAIRHHLSWIEDDSNDDTAYSRNYLRTHVMPLLRERWPTCVEHMAKSAQHCQQAFDNLNDLAFLDCPDIFQGSHVPLSLKLLRTLSVARATNVLCAWLKQTRLRMPSAHIIQRIVHEVIFSDQKKDTMIEFGGYAVRQYQQMLYWVMHTKPVSIAMDWLDFPKPLYLAHREQYLYANGVSSGLLVPENGHITVRTRCGGETMRLHGQTKSLKKLFQEWHVPPWLRDDICLIFIDGVLAQVPGFAISDVYYVKNHAQAISISLESQGKMLF